LKIKSITEKRGRFNLANTQWKEEEDNFCLSQLGEWRLLLRNLSQGDINSTKDDFIKELRQNVKFINRTDPAIVQHFYFLNRLTLGEILESNIPIKYKHLNGIHKNAEGK